MKRVYFLPMFFLFISCSDNVDENRNERSADKVIEIDKHEVKVQPNYTEEERKEIFKELAFCELKAQEVADIEYSTGSPENSEKNAAVYEKMLVEFTKEIIKKYNLSDEAADSILSEGITKEWPLKYL